MSKKNTAIRDAISELYQLVAESKNPDSDSYKRGGNYRIGLNKAIGVLFDNIEKEESQIIDVYKDGVINGRKSITMKGEDYFNETYNK